MVSGVRITKSDAMMRSAWMAYDKDGRCVASGVLGMGNMKHSDSPAAEIKAGVDAYEAIYTEIIVFHPEAGVCAAFCPAPPATTRERS